MSDPVIEIDHATFRWPKAQSDTLNIEKLTIKQGEHLFIKGPSGCGKSTLLGLLSGINIASSGSLKVLTQELKNLSQSQRDRFRADHLGYIFQQFNLLPYLSVIDNVLLPCHFSKLRKQRLSHSPQQQALQLLNRLQLNENLFNKPIIELSIGQQQRVAAARALIGQPELIIADEPTSALDFDNRVAFIELLMEQAKQAGATLIFVSHDPTLEQSFERVLELPKLNRASVLN